MMMVVGGMNQYLAKVQGMPPEVEKTLERRVRAFQWNDKKTYSGEQGDARNEA